MIKIIFKALNRFLPNSFKKQIKNFKILSINYGQWQSIVKNDAIDNNENPIPWYTYPAIEYLKRFDITDKHVYEWGSGNSSLFWAKNAKKVICVEGNRKWFDIINKRKEDNQTIIFCEKKSDFVKSVVGQNKKFDIVVIDGKYRYECAKYAIKCLSKDGFIILDNSDWYPKTANLLKNQDLIQVDFNGFGPINNYAWTTSMFFTRNFDFKFKQLIQPEGGLKQYGEE